MKNLIKWTVVMGGLLLVAASVQAQQETSAAESTEQTEMKLVVVKDENEKPSRNVITAETIERKQSGDLEDTFRNTPDVIVGGSQKSAQKVYVRGIEDINLNVTVDGARQSGYLFHHQGRLSVDTELLKKVEVDAGTGNALSGPGALGGALRFETKDADDLLRNGQQYGALVKARYASNSDEKGLGLGVYGKPLDKWGFLLYGNFAESGDSHAGGGDAIAYTAAKPKSGLVKLSYQPTQNQKVTYSGNYRDDNASRLLRNHFGPAASNQANDQKYHSLTHALNYDYQSGNPFFNLHTEVYDTVTELRHENTNGTSNSGWHSIGAAVSNTIELENLSWTTGLDANQDVAKSQGSVRSAQETSKIYGLFTQARYRLTERWNLAAGLRFDEYNLEDVAGNDLKKDHLSPNLKAQYQWNEIFATYASYSQAFKGPTPMEAFVMNGATSVAPAGDLKGTVAETYELGQEVTWNNQKSSLVLYTTTLHDPIDSGVARNTGIASRKNSDDIITKGATLSWGGVWDQFGTQASYSHNKIEYGSGQPLGYVAFGKGNSYGDRVNISFDYKFVESRWLLGWDSLIAMKLTDVPAGSVEQPGYDIHDISATWNADANLRFAFSVQNIFDKKYLAQGTPYQFGGGENTIYEPGRDFRLTASYQF